MPNSEHGNTYSPAFKQVFNGKGILTTYSTSTQLAHRHEQPSHQGKTFHIVLICILNYPTACLIQ